MHMISGDLSKSGRYSPGIASHGMLYVSGQLPIDHDTGELVSGGIEEQTRAALRNIERIFAKAGLTKESVVLCRVHIPDVRLWDETNQVCADFFGSHTPARVVVPTRELHHEALVDIEATAEMSEEN